MKTLVLDDDPTGTQSASNVLVLLQWDSALIAESLRIHDTVYLQTNTRAVDEAAAVALLEGIRRDRAEAERLIGERIDVVLRGDSTLRGHVFAETEVFAGPDDIVLFVPAFPQGGRTTVDGMHLVRVDGHDLPAHESEYASDPVFPFSTGYLPDYVGQRSGRPAVVVALDAVRGGYVGNAIAAAPAGAIVLPDVETDDDVRLIARAVRQAWTDGRRVIVRCASPLAAAIAGVESEGLLESPLLEGPATTLLVCGSHTEGATRQIQRVESRRGPLETVDTGAAIEGGPTEAARITARLRETLGKRGFAGLASDRDRKPEHNTLDHGERVMAVLVAVVASLRSELRVVIAKGGITSADIATHGLGADRALVLGQILPGVSVWSLTTREGTDILYVVVPGNVGASETIDRILDLLQVPVREPAG